MMVTTLTARCLLALTWGLILGVACSSAAAPTPTPSGEFLCSAGPRDGLACTSDNDCAPNGVCVIGQGVCNGGDSDGDPCECVAGSCSSTPVCSTDAARGTCQGGPRASQCCSVEDNCFGGGPCVAAQRVCLGGNNKGFSCLRDAQCPESMCRSTGKFCNGGDFDGFSCVDNADCSGGGICTGTGPPPPTPTPKPNTSLCAGDCDGTLSVVVSEIITLVNIVLGSQDASACSVGNPSGVAINVALIIQAVNNALNGCPSPPLTGEFLCSAGPFDGRACNSDDDCAPSGACVIGQGVCDGGTDDGAPCDCAAGRCAAAPACSTDATFGTCQGGPRATECCDVAYNCSGARPCIGSQKVCVGGDGKGFSCVRDDQCPASLCRSTGKFCAGGDFDGFSCVDNADCNIAGGIGGGICTGPAPPPTRTPTIPQCIQATPRPDITCDSTVCSTNCRLFGRDGRCRVISAECTCDTEGPTPTATPLCHP